MKFNVNLKKIVTAASVAVVAISAFAISSRVAYAHGWVVDDRAWLGSPAGGRLNINMGGVVNEPQSVGELGRRFAVENGHVSLNDAISANSGSIGGFAAMSQYGANRWHRTIRHGGQNQITWHFTAPHRTHSIVYYITREGWNPDAPLNFADFEYITTFDGHGQQPPVDLTHTINLPTDRAGKHTIFIAWHVADNNVSWYRVMDIYLKNDGFVANPPSQPADRPDGQPAPWNANDVFLGNDRVTHNGAIWMAQWWTQGNEPGTNPVWLFISEIVPDVDVPDDFVPPCCEDRDDDFGTPELPEPPVTPPTPPVTPPTGSAWVATAIYVENDIVTHNGATWQAQWWTTGEEPGTTGQWGVWRLIEGSAPVQPDAPAAPAQPTPPTTPEVDGVRNWDATAGNVFNEGDIVSFNGQLFRARQTFTTNGDDNWGPGASLALWVALS